MTDKDRSRLLDAYREVFLPDWEIRNCGRDDAMALIGLLDAAEPGIRHGDPRTGFLYLDAVKGAAGRLGIQGLLEGP